MKEPDDEQHRRRPGPSPVRGTPRPGRLSVLVAVLSAPWQIRIGRTQALEDADGILWVAGLMWMPALASVIVRLSTRQGFADVTFRRTLGPRWLLLAPLAVAAPAYALALLLDLVQPDVNRSVRSSPSSSPPPSRTSSSFRARRSGGGASWSPDSSMPGSRHHW